MTDAVYALATWVLTYGVHSAAFCVLALLGARVLSRPGQRDPLWKLALAAPPLTALAALLPAGPRVEVPALLRAVAPGTWAPAEVTVNVVRTAGEATVTRSVTDGVAWVLAVAVLVLAAVPVLRAVAGYAAARRDLGRLLRGRRPAAPGEMDAALDGLSRRPPRLSVSERLAAPVALGRAEVCVPRDLPLRLSPAQLRALLAHEAAHLERRDPRWIAAAEWVAALSAFQPLARRVVAALRRDAELACDDAAVRRTGDAAALARALTVLAEAFDPAAPAHRVAVASDGSPLVQRVERLVERARGTGAPSSRAGWLPAVLAGAATAALLAATGPVLSAAPAAPGHAAVPRNAVTEIETTSVQRADPAGRR
jgi:beta-lactamase regulating signal transducer with metallopeptidase domain